MDESIAFSVAHAASTRMRRGFGMLARCGILFTFFHPEGKTLGDSA